MQTAVLVISAEGAVQVLAFRSNQGQMKDSGVDWQWERIWNEGCWVTADRVATSQCCDTKTFFSALMREGTISQSAECVIGRTLSLIEATWGKKDLIIIRQWRLLTAIKRTRSHVYICCFYSNYYLKTIKTPHLHQAYWQTAHYL